MPIAAGVRHVCRVFIFPVIARAFVFRLVKTDPNPHTLMLSQALLRFWSPQEHGCWTLLLSAGPAPNSGGGQLCTMLHDLIR